MVDEPQICRCLYHNIASTTLMAWRMERPHVPLRSTRGWTQPASPMLPLALSLAGAIMPACKVRISHVKTLKKRAEIRGHSLARFFCVILCFFACDLDDSRRVSLLRFLSVVAGGPGLCSSASLRVSQKIPCGTVFVA